MTKRALTIGIALLLGGCAGSASEPEPAHAPIDTIDEPAFEPAARESDQIVLPSAREQLGIHNVLVAGEGVVSGSTPEGDEGFATLRCLGIKTIISVDGAAPDVERAAAHGLRYVHIPIQYNGIEPDARMKIVRAMRELEGPFYVHCHHGLHRGPAAAAYGLVACGKLAPDKGVAFLHEAGTSESYPGLYTLVYEARYVSDRDLAIAIGDGRARLVPVAKVDGFVETMAAIDQSWDHLELIRDAGWRTPPDHPDLVPAAEAGMLADLFRSLADKGETTDRPPDFATRMKSAHSAAQALEDAIVAGADATEAMERLGAACTDCHNTYRNK